MKVHPPEKAMRPKRTPIRIRDTPAVGVPVAPLDHDAPVLVDSIELRRPKTSSTPPAMTPQDFAKHVHVELAVHKRWQNRAGDAITEMDREVDALTDQVAHLEGQDFQDFTSFRAETKVGMEENGRIGKAVMRWLATLCGLALGASLGLALKLVDMGDAAGVARTERSDMDARLNALDDRVSSLVERLLPDGVTP